MELRKVIKGIIFDLDGTLYDLEVDWERLKRQIEEITGTPFESMDKVFESAQGPQRSQIAKIVNQAEIEGVIKGRPTPGAAQTINELQTDYKIAIVTRNGRQAAEAALKEIDFDAQVIIAREDVIDLKPHPEGLRLALNKLSLKPEDVVIVGDTTHDVLAAQHLHSVSVVVKNPKLQFIPKGDYELRDLSYLKVLLKKEFANG